MALYPSLDYRGLYSVLVQLLEVISQVQNGVDGNKSPISSLFPVYMVTVIPWTQFILRFFL